MKKKLIIFSVIFLILLLGYAITGAIMSDVEKPKYDVITSSGNIEVRRYYPMIVAEVAVEGEGERKKAIGSGFRILADYIFGNNSVQQEISMTSPVLKQYNEKIAMTAPVHQQEVDGVWKVSFFMPSKYSILDLPKPNNDKVILNEIPAKQLAVVTFSGAISNDNLKKYEEQLMQYIIDKSLLVKGVTKYAFYNPPWTLPFMRRNEIMIEVANN
jgi:hypothetical protein